MVFCQKLNCDMIVLKFEGYAERDCDGQDCGIDRRREYKRKVY